jgi:ferredoxin
MNMVFGALKKSTVKVEFLPANVEVTATQGDPLSAVAEAAGIEIKYKCKKGECGTCEVNVNNKWVKACQATIPKLSKGEKLTITVKPAKEVKEKPAKFFTPKSFAEGVVNNALGVYGFVTVAAKADDEFNERMRKEKELEEKVKARKSGSS